MRFGNCIVSLITTLICVTAYSADWAQFRGPGGNGISSERNLPTKWSSKENIAWRLELPGLGTSRPIVVGKNIFLTCYSGYAESADMAGDGAKLMRHVVCVDRLTGKVAWKVEVPPALPESNYEGRNNTRHGYSSSTPTSDGTNLYVFFGKSGVFCYTLDGKQVWQTRVGDGTNGWGSANSPVLFEDLVIVNASVECGDMVALDKKTGAEKWRAKGMNKSWNTPLLVRTANAEFELAVNLPSKVQGLDPRTGKELWHCEGIPDNYICPSLTADDGIIYAIGGRSKPALSVRAGGRGDVTNSHVVWRKGVGCNVSSPVYHDGHLYWLNDGFAMCVNAATGDMVYQQRVDPNSGTVYASGVLADGKLYYPSQNKGVFVVAAKPQFELLAHNVFDDDESRMNASVAIQDGQILLRNDKYLYCIGQRRDLANFSPR